MGKVTDEEFAQLAKNFPNKEEMFNDVFNRVTGFEADKEGNFKLTGPVNVECPNGDVLRLKTHVLYAKGYKLRGSVRKSGSAVSGEATAHHRKGTIIWDFVPSGKNAELLKPYEITAKPIY